MIPSDHFVKFYNEIFKYLERRGGDALDRYYARVADRQAYFTLDAFKRDGLKGMYDYWERIRIEENCDMTHEYNDTFYHCHMNTCPSLSKVLTTRSRADATATTVPAGWGASSRWRTTSWCTTSSGARRRSARSGCSATSRSPRPSIRSLSRCAAKIW